MPNDPLVFHSGKQYMTAKEEEAILEFMKSIPDMSMLYTKGNKEQRCDMFRLPLGSYVPGYSQKIGEPNPPDGTFYYTTRNARVAYQGTAAKNIKVWVTDIKTGDMSIITGGQWMEFVKTAIMSPLKTDESQLLMSKADNAAYFENMKLAENQRQRNKSDDEVAKKAIESAKPKKPKDTRKRR